MFSQCTLTRVLGRATRLFYRSSPAAVFHVCGAYASPKSTVAASVARIRAACSTTRPSVGACAALTTTRLVGGSCPTRITASASGMSAISAEFSTTPVRIWRTTDRGRSPSREIPTIRCPQWWVVAVQCRPIPTVVSAIGC